MSNILGLDDFTFSKVEREIIKLKLSLIDERFTFMGGVFLV